MRTKNTKTIRAGREKVYNAFVNKEALEHWLAPDNMTGKIHDFNVRVGGGYQMSLYYRDDQAKGKTTGNEDRFSVRFVTLQPFEKIVQAIVFESEDSRFGGEMIMETVLTTEDGPCTTVTIVFKHIPPGISPEDNEAGTAQSLEKLARYLEQD